ncbi:MAG TPA: PDZ domain-containing protein [Ferruginibacter sp.]|nr:PDZ domain-containing protein [Ferruginibacter sp.]
MKKIVFTAACIAFAAITNTSFAQDGKADKEKTETQEIVIRKKGDKDTKVTVEIKGDNVTINGKPLSEFKDDEITINKRNIIIRDGRGNTRLRMTPNDFEGLSFWNDDNDKPTAFLGVTTSAFDEDKNTGGAKVTNISAESGAEKAGLQKGDIIVKINSKEVKNPESLSEIVTSFKPKDEVTVYYKRDGKESSAKATLGDRKESNVMAYSFSGPNGVARSFTMPRVNGIYMNPKVELWNDKELGDMSPRIWSPNGKNNYEYNFNMFPRQQKLGLKIQDTEDSKGVKVLEVDKDSPAEKAGLKKDDVVTEIGGKKVSNTDEAREQLHQNMEKSAYNIKANRNGNSMNFDIKIPKKLKTADL